MLRNVGTGMPFQLTASNDPLQGGEKVVNSNSGPPGSANIGRLANDFVNSKVHFSEQNVNDGPKAGKAVQSNFPTQRVPQVTTVAHDHVSVIDTKLVSPEPSGNEEGFASPKKPHTESEYAYGSQSNEYLGQKNSANQLSGLQQGSSTFPWDLVNQLSAKDASLYQTDIPSKQKYNTEIQVQHKGGQPDHGQPAFAASRDNEQNKQHMKGMDVLLKQSVHFQRGNRSLDSWSEEYQSLIEKLKDLYGKAHGNPSPGQSASSSNKPAFNDTQQMMQEVARFHSLFVGRDSNPRGIVEDKGMFFKDLKGDDAKPEHWGNAGQMSISDYLPYIPNKDRENYSGVSNRNISATSFENSAEVLGQVRSIQVANKTLFGTSNSTNLPKEVLNMADPNNSNIEKVVNGTVEENNGNVSNNSDSLSSQHDGRSSHQVLMSYFRNETGLRKWLHLNDDNQNELHVTASALKGLPIQLDNNITHTATESAEIKTKQPNAFHIAVDNANHSDSGISKQGKNVSQEEEQESLTKYLEDFISLVSSEGIAPSIEGNETTKHEAGPEPPPNAVSASAASKKENVTDLKNREIIVVSPKSLRDLMKNRSRNSSLPVVHKGIPITVNKAKNSTLKLDFSLNKTAVNVQEQGKNLSGNATIHHQVSKDRPTLQIVNDTSNKDSVTSKSENDDLNVLYRDELKSLEISLSRDFMSSWIYYQKSLDEIGITPNMLRSGIANLGSAQRLKRVFKKALAGTDLNVLVVGGSISAGGGLEKDRGNVEGVYHKAFSDWWNNTVAPITTSQLKINTVAIGGTDSEYFSYCIKNYMRSLPDIVIWELAANDYKRYTGRDFAPAKPLEQLTRIILSLPSHPALILANFFRGNYYKTAVDQDCPDSEDEGGKSIAQYYKLTSLSWRNVICSGENGKDLDLKKLFSSDGYHPSLLGHAQMSSLLISYFKGVFEQTISEEMIKLRNRTRQSLQHDVLPSLAEPIFDDPETPTPLCWTLLTPDYDQKLRNTLPDLEFTEATGFQFANISHWPIRRDRLRCLKAIQTGAMLKMKFNVPSRENNGGHSGSYKRELAVTTHNSFGGMGTLWLDGDQSSARIIKEQKGQRRTQVNVLTQTLTPGAHTVTVYALQPGFCLSAVAVL
ncbi:hypothetical protein OS493_036605 [Desmophyllum pertusum]|uniref:SGNH hydrolase-type esterase domain-containing protein n=1 Tax=Desmophyllum pertusum TaxID=174260 RepID=A0A9W9ZIA1_9CNID|nr:hypothetical protein OS493_036605 [Desmophyllum pertusum]